MDATQTVGLTRKLEFTAQLDGLQPVDNDALIEALRHPCAESFTRALDLLRGAAAQRAARVQGDAVEAAAAVGEADLRRLKRQFSSLKNTFLHYEVKNEFLAELLDGRPHGDEGELLQHFEAEVDSSVAELRQLKAANEEAQAAIVDVVSRVAAAHEALDRQRAAVAAELARLQAEAEAHAAGAHEPLPDLPDGPEEAEVASGLAASRSEERELEAAIAAQLGEAAELEAAIAAEREEAEALRAQLGDLEHQTATQGERVEANARFLCTAQWCDEAASTVTLLGGLSLLHVARDAVHLKLVTAYPTGAAAAAGDPGPCATADHELSVHLQPGSTTVCGAELTPADVEVGDIVEAARDGGRAADFVVREVQARLGAWLHRRALVEEAGARFELAAVTHEGAGVRAKLGQGVEAEVRLTACWPAAGDAVAVVSISGAADAAKAERAAQLRFEGRSLAAALEAVERELA